MIVRTYGRRNRAMTRSCSESAFDDDVVLGSQESPQDIYDFTFSSQDSTHWPSSETSGQLTILPRVKDNESGELGDYDGVFWRPKKVRVFDESDPYGFGSSQESRELRVLPSGKEEDFEDFEGAFGKSKKKAKIGKKNKENSNCFLEKKLKKKKKGKEWGSVAVGPRATLMETQECGEMMEHVDEVNFALDGLKKGQPVRIRRASLLSLLSICGTAQQRRLLRAHGMAKTIIDAVLGLSFDDSPSNLAAATLFYILSSDGQENHLLESPSCIRFLIKLLKPLTPGATEIKAATIGSKLLAICMDADVSQESAKGVDPTLAAIMLKVQQVLVSCKEMKTRGENDLGMEKPKLDPKWISLLTMEKACLSTISIEDTSGTVRKSGGNFKEKLRELGGLNAVFEVARDCHSVTEEWLEHIQSSVFDSKESEGLESLVLLLKCLKIMENATFLSMDNQKHLLEMKGKFDGKQSPRSFTKLLLSLIKILSGVSLLRDSFGTPKDEKVFSFPNATGQPSEMPPLTGYKANSNEMLSITSSMRCLVEGTSSQKSIPPDTRCSASSQTGCSRSSRDSSTSASDSSFLKLRIESSMSGSCIGTSGSTFGGVALCDSSSRLKNVTSSRQKASEATTFEPAEDSQDPFAFHEEDFEPSKWDLLSGKQKVCQTQKGRATVQGHIHDSQSHPLLGQQESNYIDREVSTQSTDDEEKYNLLADCLLTAVKVLMNLTNDNPLGCQQIAACGGLEILSSLIAGHFPSFSSCLHPSRGLVEDSSSSKSSIQSIHQNDVHLSDQELDFLVAILGLLVNLVEKDSRNRSHLAAASVSLPSLDSSDKEVHSNVIPLLCSIFLANQGAGEGAGEGKCFQWDDEDAVLQGEKEAEKMIIEAYSALLLAFLSTESKKIRHSIAECLPNHNLAILIPVLERFVEFHLSLNMISPDTHKTVLEVIESCRVP